MFQQQNAFTFTLTATAKPQTGEGWDSGINRWIH